MLERFFDLKAQGTTAATEIRAGIATFLTMAYILLVNPQILSQAGLPVADATLATALAAAIGSFVMGLYANYPFALAPGMGLNAYFTFSVVIGMGVSYEVALAAVFIEGLLFLALSLIGVRKALLHAIPMSLKVAIAGGIGLFLALIGLQNAGVVIGNPATLVTLGDLHTPSVWLALGGFILTAVLLTRKMVGAIVLGIIAVTLVAWGTGITPRPTDIFSMPQLPRETFAAFDFSSLLTGKLLLVVLAFLFVDLFDTAGTLIGVGRLGGFLDKRGHLPRADRAFTADAVGTTVGAILGTSTVTSYIESAAGIEEGGRTGLTAVVVGLLFTLALFFTPLFTAVPAAATAPALLIVGAFMLESVREVPWKEPDEAIPAFLTIAAMPFTYSIAHGIVFGLVSYTALKLLSGKGHEVHPLLYGLVALLIAYFVFVAS